MRSSDPKSKPALGFLTVVEDSQDGLFGGYLLLNLAGRPLEFHCTAPVKPNRAQQILYGPTLAPYLFGEQIGQTLLSKSKLQPLVVCTDREPALSLREYVDVPVTLVLPKEGEDSPDSANDPGGKLWRVDAAHASCATTAPFHLGRNRLVIHHSYSEDSRLVTERLAEVADSFDLAEPFARIREAIAEARQGG
jgi:hypothetical protein